MYLCFEGSISSHVAWGFNCCGNELREKGFGSSLSTPLVLVVNVVSAHQVLHSEWKLWSFRGRD